MAIKDVITAIRKEAGITQEEMARRLYVTRQAVSRWEQGRTLPDVQSMLLLANLFGTTIDELVRGDVDEMREMVEKDEQQRKAFAIALGAVEVTVIAVLAFMATAGRDYLDSALLRWRRRECWDGTRTPRGRRPSCRRSGSRA